MSLGNLLGHYCDRRRCSCGSEDQDLDDMEGGQAFGGSLGDQKKERPHPIEVPQGVCLQI